MACVVCLTGAGCLLLTTGFAVYVMFPEDVAYWNPAAAAVAAGFRKGAGCDEGAVV